MKTNRDFPTALSAFSALVDSSAAVDAAQRLYDNHRAGFRHCCDSREILTTDEAMARDAREAARRARPAADEVATVDDFSDAEESVPMSDSTDDDDELADDNVDDEDAVIDFDDDDIVASDDDEELYGHLIDDVAI